MRKQCYTLLWRSCCALLFFFLFAPPVAAQTEVVQISGATTATWTAPPAGGPYFVRITAKGGDGGTGGVFNGNTTAGGGGATLSGTFQLEAGQTLLAISGARGANGFFGPSIAGGGAGGAGSGVVNVTTNIILLIAGGGSGAGGAFIPSNGTSALASEGDGSGGPSCCRGREGGGGGLNGDGGSSSDGATGGEQVKKDGLSAGGAGGSGKGGAGMGGGGGAQSGGGGGGGQTGGSNVNGSAPRSLRGGACQQNIDGKTTLSPEDGFVTITLLVSTTPYYRDADGDSFGNPTSMIFGPADCTPPGYTANNSDCDDSNKNVNPGATEVSNGIDDDCDEQVDEGLQPAVWFRDFDGDGFGDPAKRMSASTQPSGYVSNSQDCNDYRTYYQDNDNDGWGNSTKLPCGTITRTGDCDDNNNKVHSLQTFYRDADGDSYGNPSVSIQRCTSVPPTGYVKNNQDCNDSNPAVRSCPPASMTTTGGSRIEDGARQPIPDVLLWAHPNPIRSTVRLQYTLPAEARITLRLLDGFGRQVALLQQGQRPAGTHTVSYDAQRLAAGIYYLELRSKTGGKEAVHTKQVVRQK